MTPQLHSSRKNVSIVHTHNRFTALWNLSGTTRVSRYQKKHSPTHTHHGHQSSQSAFSIYYEPWHPPYSIHVSIVVPRYVTSVAEVAAELAAGAAGRLPSNSPAGPARPPTVYVTSLLCCYRCG